MSRSLSNRAFLDFAMEAAWQAGRTTLAHFQTGVPVERKSDQSPVTVVDRNAELLLRQAIAARFPDHAVAGEEFGSSDADSRYLWILDPIDGTESFVRGVPLYGVLVGLEIAGEMVAGVAHFPALGETVAAAKGEGCSCNGRPARVSGVRRIEEAFLVYTDARELERREGWTRLQRTTHRQRGFGDCYGHCLVATGRADIALDPLMKPWDCAALVPILQEAGGTFTDWTGATTIHGGDAISTNGALFEEVLRLVRGTDSA